MNCSLCKDIIDTESPYDIYTKNPNTNRLSWMHWWCFQNILDDMKIQKSMNIEFENIYDEYLSKG